MSMRRRAQKKRIGLALGGGGARGWAHIGVIKTLLEAGVKIECVAGASMGALVGAAFAAGRLETLEQVAVQLDWKRVLYYFLEWSFPRAGLVDGRRVMEFLAEQIGPLTFDRLALPFIAVATDLYTGQEAPLDRGNVLEAVRASIAIPGLFTPAIVGDRTLVDGGLTNPIPVSAARRLGANYVIAVDIVRAPTPPATSPPKAPRYRLQRPTSEIAGRLFDALESLRSGGKPARDRFARPRRAELPNLFEVFGNSARIVQRQIADMRLEKDPPEVLIEPAVQDINTMDFHRAAEAITAGADAARRLLQRSRL